ncbi:hypothetical protein QQ056_17575 [Oscillatoria laete-virens NRMC-F 0139]|nr:hypothetical protein [Oscillatoria laete-virens]MDL5055345.1 hypothetical protein [Oscillatoria laete-virens NRMC-F 0139]
MNANEAERNKISDADIRALKSLLKTSGFNMKDLAQFLGRSHGRIRNFFGGGNRSPKLHRKIQDFLIIKTKGS